MKSSLCRLFSFYNFLRTKAHAAFQRNRFSIHIFEIGRCDLHTHATNITLRITEITCRRCFHIGFERFGISFLKVFKLSRPCKRTNNVGVDAILCPFGCCNTRKTANTFLCCRIGALTIITEKSCTRSKIDDASLCFLEMRIACLHIIKCCVKS